MAISFAFNIKNDEGSGWNPGTVFFYNGDINEIQGFHNSEELKYIKQVYKETTGRDLKEYVWDAKKAPVYNRLFGTLRPGGINGDPNSVANLLKKIGNELAEAND